MDEKTFSTGGGYQWLDAWVLANVIQLGTQKFCLRFLKPRIDPCGRLFDQMTQAARSGVANIAEGYARRATSKETEMRLTDVAKASFAELTGDYLNWLLLAGQTPWSESDPEAREVFSTDLEKASFRSDVACNSARHILGQYARFSRWLDAADSLVVARAMLVLLARENMMLGRKLAATHAGFVREGGFAENLTKDRLAARDAAHAAAGDAPACPKCGKPMRKRVARRGENAGNEFWSCTGWPDCRGTRPI